MSQFFQFSFSINGSKLLNAAADFPVRASESKSPRREGEKEERREREGGRKSAAGEGYFEKGGERERNERNETLNVFPLGANQFPNLTELPWRCPVAKRDL